MAVPPNGELHYNPLPRGGIGPSCAQRLEHAGARTVVEPLEVDVAVLHVAIPRAARVAHGLHGIIDQWT